MVNGLKIFFMANVYMTLTIAGITEQVPHVMHLLPEKHDNKRKMEAKHVMTHTVRQNDNCVSWYSIFSSTRRPSSGLFLQAYNCRDHELLFNMLAVTGQ